MAKGFSKAGSGDVVDKHLDAAFNMMVESPPRRRSLRCSGLPYCGILDAIIPEEPEYSNLEGSLYTGMGTSAHASLQFFMSLGKEGANVWGSWQCAKCKKKLTYQFRPDDCCGQPMLYVEVDFRVGPLTGHVDLICRYNGKFIVYEFKTIGDEPKKPKREHQLQVRHYVALLKLNFKIDVYGYTIVYIGRPHLERWKFGPYSAKDSIQQTTDWIFRAIKGFKAATQVRTNPTKHNIKELIAARPCKSEKDFDEYMSRRYEFSRRPCPLLQACTKGDKACYAVVSEMLEG